MEISYFRDFVNNNLGLLNEYLEDNEGRKIVPIQSSLDWFETSVHFFNQYRIESNCSPDVYSFLCFAKIIAIDNIVESVITLKKALKIEKMKTKKELVFLKTLEIFDGNILKDKSDYLHFKNLRAIFGAHTVDIQLLIDNAKVPYYAQWSSRLVGDADISVFIHSTERGRERIRVDLHFDKLEKIIDKAEEELDSILDFLKKCDVLIGRLNLSNFEESRHMEFQVVHID